MNLILHSHTYELVLDEHIKRRCSIAPLHTGWL